MAAPQTRPSIPATVGQNARSTAALERWPPGRWVYVGDYPTDADTTPDSPPFENDWTNAGGGLRRLRFRRTNEWGLEIAGTVAPGSTDSVAGSVVVQLGGLYQPDESEFADGQDEMGCMVTWRLDPNGDLVYLGTCGGETVESLSKSGDSALTGAVTLSEGTGIALTQAGQDIEIASTVTAGVETIAKSGDTPLTGDVTLSAGAGVALTQTGQDIAIAAAAAAGSSVLLYDYIVAGSDKASIDTFVDDGGFGTSVALSGAYRLLEIFIYNRTDEATTDAGYTAIVNNDTGSNYDRQALTAANASVTAGNARGTASWSLDTYGANAAANNFKVTTMSFFNYAGTVGFKTGTLLDGGAETTAANCRTDLQILTWRSTSAITRLAISAPSTKKFKVGTRLTIFAR